MNFILVAKNIGCYKDTLQEAKACTEPNYAIVLSDSSEYVSKVNQGGKLNGSLVTDFSEIANKDFYQLTARGGNGYWFKDIHVDSNGDVSDEYMSSDSNFHISVDNGTIHITGSDEGESVDETRKLYKYN